MILLFQLLGVYLGFFCFYLHQRLNRGSDNDVQKTSCTMLFISTMANKNTRGYASNIEVNLCILCTSTGAAVAQSVRDWAERFLVLRHLGCRPKTFKYYQGTLQQCINPSKFSSLLSGATCSLSVTSPSVYMCSFV